VVRKSARIRSGVIKKANPIRFKYYKQLSEWFPNPYNYIKANGFFHVFGYIQANKNSSTYKIEFLSKGTRIMVLVHDIVIHGELKSIPHIFFSESSKKKRYLSLCLYRNKKNRIEFTFGDDLRKTIIPWTQEWLYFYELFLITGQWYGNGEHPE